MNGLFSLRRKRRAGRTNIEAAEQFVEFGIQERSKGNRESASGPGSSQLSTVEVSDMILQCVRDRSVKSVLDLGCGDWNWMRHLMVRNEFAAVHYEGWESHAGLVETLNADFGSESRVFKQQDIFAGQIPASDLVICRDVLFHVDIELAARLIEELKSSGCRYFVSTSFSDQVSNTNIRKYLDIDGWGFYQINLEIAPFRLADCLIQKVEEKHCADAGQRRYVCLFEFQ